MKISAIIIAKNEAPRIAACLTSVSWVDEIIVIDNGSADKTMDIAKKHGATVISSKEHNFANLRSIGGDCARGEWILYVDADEVVTPQLVKEIKEVASRQQSAISGYEIRRKNYYLGYPWPGDEYILRLMRKDALKEWYGELHESPVVKGESGTLHAPLLHDTHRTLEEMVTKTNEWSKVEAILRLRAGHPPVVWWRFIRVMLTAFLDSFFRQGGWRAGVVGWIESIYQSFSIFITYAKLWELQQKKRL